MTKEGHEYRVEQLASESGVRVDTIRYYQGLGLLPPASKQGRIALYEKKHLIRLRTIRALADDGFSLAQVKRLLEEGNAPLLTTLAGSSGNLTLDELAELSGLEKDLVELAVSAGLVETETDLDGERFPPEAAAMLAAGKALLETGFPLHRLAALATRHATGVEEVIDEAIDLFAQYVRPEQSDSAGDLALLFQTLVAMVTRLVAQHFQQTVITRVKERMAGSDDLALVKALEAADEGHLVISAEWR